MDSRWTVTRWSSGEGGAMAAVGAVVHESGSKREEIDVADPVGAT